jgi:hypothetical protein
MSQKYLACPYCGEVWSILEVQDQECYECGYPNPVDEQDSVVSGAGLGQLIPHSKGGLTTFSPIQKTNQDYKSRYRSDLR